MTTDLRGHRLSSIHHSATTTRSKARTRPLSHLTWIVVVVLLLYNANRQHVTLMEQSVPTASTLRQPLIEASAPTAPKLDCIELLYPKTDLTTFGFLKNTSSWEYQYYNGNNAIRMMDPARYPVLPESFVLRDKTADAVRIRAFVRKEGKGFHTKNEYRHIVEDGIRRSPLLHLQGIVFLNQAGKSVQVVGEGGSPLDPTSLENDEVWVIDSSRFANHEAHGCPQCCDKLQSLLDETLATRQQQQQQQRQEEKGQPSKNQTPPLYILALDADDNDVTYECSTLTKYHHYRFAKRSIVRGRRWADDLQFALRGNLIVNQSVSNEPARERRSTPSTTILHFPYTVRTDLVHAIGSEILGMSTEANLTTPLDVTERPIDVAHFYTRQFDDGTRAYFDNLRNGVNAILLSLNGTAIYGNTCRQQQPRRLRVFVGLAGAHMKRGRNHAHPDYARQLLRSKIVVVAQRDQWVGHYRLMEALVSGGLVLADYTETLPKGLRHGESLILYSSFSELRRFILYYLHHDDERMRIAQRGWEIAMGYHRSWHAMEALLFGKPQTRINHSYATLVD